MWIRATTNRKCPICDGKSWCQWTDKVVVCMRIMPGSYKTISIDGNEGYLHRTDSSIPNDVSGIPLAPAEQLNKVYSVLLNGDLGFKHQSYLKSRSVSSEQVKKNWYTSLSDSWQERSIVAASIAETEKLEGVPGFWEHKEEWQLEGPGGILLPVVNSKGLTVGCQILNSAVIKLWFEYTRVGLEIPESQEQPAKYLWLSSAPTPRNGMFGDYIGRKTGTGAKPVPHCRFKTYEDVFEARNRILVVEGVLKADTVAHLTKANVLGLPGINAARDEAATIAAGFNKIQIALDIDWRTNEHVRTAMQGFIDRLLKVKQSETIEVLVWPEEFGKGLDDVLLAGHRGIVAVPVTNWLSTEQQ